MPIRREIQLCFFLLFLLFLNWPIISVTAERWTGFDLFRILFVLWSVMILVLFFLGRGIGPSPGEGSREE